jgi:hypothetical protein
VQQWLKQEFPKIKALAHASTPRWCKSMHLCA